MCGVSGALVSPAPQASGRGSPGRLLPALAMRPGLTPTFDGFGDAATPCQGLAPTFDGFGQEPPGTAGAAPGGRAPETGLPGVMEAAPSRRPGLAASGWPKPSKVGAGAASRRRPRPKPSKVGGERVGGARGAAAAGAAPAAPSAAGSPRRGRPRSSRGWPSVSVWGRWRRDWFPLACPESRRASSTGFELCGVPRVKGALIR